MFNVGTGELIVIAVVALLVLGPKRLPELARGIGKFMREFRRQTDDVRNVVEREFYRMDQEINSEVPKIETPQGAIATGHEIAADAALHPPDPHAATLLPGAVADPYAATLVPGAALDPSATLVVPSPTRVDPTASTLVEPPPIVDESDPGHPDYHREEKPAEEAAPAPASTQQKAS